MPLHSTITLFFYDLFLEPFQNLRKPFHKISVYHSLILNYCKKMQIIEIKVDIIHYKSLILTIDK